MADLTGGGYHVRMSGVCEICLSITSHGNAKWCEGCRPLAKAAAKRLTNAKATWRNRVRTCVSCGIEWCNVGYPGVGRHGLVKFCSLCRPGGRPEPVRKRTDDWTCESCGVVFDPRSNSQRFHSVSCRDKASGRIRQWIKPAERLAIYERDGFVCWLCDERVDPDDFDVNDDGYYVFGHRYPTLDHVQPRSRGGSDDSDNLRTAHHICNSRRKAKVAA